MELFRPFVQSVGDFATPNCDLEQVCDIIRASANSAPGPDGIPYSAYFAVLDLSADMLWNCFGDDLCGDPLPDEMRESLMIFSPKGDLEQGQNVLPGDVRPLSLCSTRTASSLLLF